MPEHQLYLPEGFRPSEPLRPAVLTAAREEGRILEAPVLRCDGTHTLWVDLQDGLGYIPCEEAISPQVAGAEREVSLLSCVGRKVCFVVQERQAQADGSVRWKLSRRAAQERALEQLEQLPQGTVLRCRVTHLARFGAFADIGCGIIALLPLERIAMARVRHSAERFRLGQSIRAVLHTVDRENHRFTLSHRELLGTWLENAADFHEGDTVAGIVRHIEPYGVFVELTPNLCGLAEPKEGYAVGDGAVVKIRTIRPEGHKVKLWLVNPLPLRPRQPLRYRITDGIVRRWDY